MKFGGKQSLYFDATSSIVQNIPDQKSVFLYSLVWKHPISGRVAIPAAEMISTDQHSREIQHFLSCVCDSARENGFLFKPHKIESDLSFAILQAECQTFNGCDVRGYLDWCWRVHRGEMTTQQIKSKTIIHTCAAHCIKMFSRQLAKYVASLKLRKFILCCLGQFLNLTKLPEIRGFFKLLCTVLGSPDLDKRVEAGLALLQIYVQKGVTVEIDEQTVSDPESIQSFAGVRKSEFYRFCYTIYANRHIAVDTGKPNNYYCTEFMQVFLDNYTGLMPLWTGLMLGGVSSLGNDSSGDVSTKRIPEVTRDSTSCVENYFGNLKGTVIHAHIV